MKKTLTATAVAPYDTAPEDHPEAHWTTYKDRPPTMNLQELAVWMLTTNPNMAVSLLMQTLEHNATLPTGTENKIVEVSVFDEEGNPEYNLTEAGQFYYEQTVPE
jgi:hypothetical protein